MLFSIFAFIVGYLSLSTSCPAKTANLLSSLSVSSFGFHVREGRACFRCLLFSKKKLLAALEEHDIAVADLRVGGLPGFFLRYRWRVGAFLGAAACVMLTLLSQNFVWQIEVVGNEKVPDGEILAALAAEGVYEGAYIKNIDPLAAANRCVMKSDLLSWMSVNIVGNHIEAVVVEYSDREVAERDKAPSNIVAKKSGIIRRIELVSGVAVAGEGRVVSEGELLVSGVNLLRNEKYIYQPAKGKVYAETLNQAVLEQPLLTEEKVYTGRVFTEKSYIFFTKSKKVSEYSGNLPANCDRIETKERVMLFGKIPLPLWVHKVEYREFVYTEKTLSEEEAREILAARAAELLLSGELVSREDAYSFDGEKVTLTMRYRLVEDIAKNLLLFESP